MSHKYNAEIAEKRAAARAEIRLSALANKSYAQLQTYINNNVTDLASARTVLKKMANVILALLKERDLSS